MDGHLNIVSTLTLTDDPNDLDNMQIDTSLTGVSIDLPSPLGKSAEQNKPLVIKVDFNPEKAADCALITVIKLIVICGLPAKMTAWN